MLVSHIWPLSGGGGDDEWEAYFIRRAWQDKLAHIISGLHQPLGHQMTTGESHVSTTSSEIPNMEYSIRAASVEDCKDIARMLMVSGHKSACIKAVL